MKEQPFRYFMLKTYQKRNATPPYNHNLWRWVKETIKAGKPKGLKKQ